MRTLRATRGYFAERNIRSHPERGLLKWRVNRAVYGITDYSSCYGNLEPEL